MRILLVEDDKGIVRFVRKGLLENSFSVDVAANGEEGLNAVLRMKYDLVVLDILLPENGREGGSEEDPVHGCSNPCDLFDR